MSRARAGASSRVPNTKKQMNARGRRPSAFICLLDVFGTRDEARSPSFRACLHGGGGPQVGEVTRLGKGKVK